MGNPQPNLLEIGWLAGIIDGEGTITVCKTHRKNPNANLLFSPRVQVINTNADIIQKVCEILDVHNISFSIQEVQGHLGSKQIWRVILTRMSEIAKLMNLIKSCLVGKRSQAELMSRFVDSRLRKYNGSKMGAGLTNKDKMYTDDEIRYLSEIVQANGDQRKGSETLLVAIDKAKQQANEIPPETDYQKCESTILRLLEKGPMLSENIKKAVRDQGISRYTLRNVRENLSKDGTIICSKAGKAWQWELTNPPLTSTDEKVHPVLKKTG